MVIEQYKTGFDHPADIPFEDLSATGGVSTGNIVQSVPAGRATVTGRAKKRTGIRALFNTSKVLSHVRRNCTSHICRCNITFCIVLVLHFL